MHFFATKFFFTLFCREHGLHIFFRENNLRTSSGKFLRAESCHPESSDFLGLWESLLKNYLLNIAEPWRWLRTEVGRKVEKEEEEEEEMEDPPTWKVWLSS